MTDIEVFLGFLKDEGIYMQYFNNIAIERNIHNVVELKVYLLFSENEDFVFHAFNWEKSNEGFSFWCVINRKWSDFYNHKNIVK